MSLPDTAVAFALGVALTAAVFGWLIERAARHVLEAKIAALEKRFEDTAARAENPLHWQTIENERARSIDAALLLDQVLKDADTARRILLPHMAEQKARREKNVAEA